MGQGKKGKGERGKGERGKGERLNLFFFPLTFNLFPPSPHLPIPPSPLCLFLTSNLGLFLSNWCWQKKWRKIWSTIFKHW
ncbi:hypothetical protein VF02_13745, partial [Nostoc linckia z1]